VLTREEEGLSGRILLEYILKDYDVKL